MREVMGSMVSPSTWGHYSAMMIECWGVYEGLKLIKRLRLRRVELNVDSMIVVKAIKGGVDNNASYLTLIRDVKKLIANHEYVQVAHTYREDNLCANALLI